MALQNKRYLSLLLWVISLISVGALIGNLTQAGVDTWYLGLNRSPLTPPNYVFGIVWTILYAIIGISGWSIWGASTANLSSIKVVYITQLLLNWSWTPLFFLYQLPGYALICLILMLTMVFAIIFMAYPRIKAVSYLFLPYFLWLMFATYLNTYIYLYN